MKKNISIIGGGPAAMSLASFLDGTTYNITLYEKNKALGRKFLVAGKGGFNLTHSEQLATLTDRYTPTSFFRETLNSFSNEDFRAWLEKIGIPTFIGSSYRVYPQKGIKPIEVLNAIELGIKQNNVAIQYNKNWQGWNSKGKIIFSDGSAISSDVVVFALGGGSWHITGSDGAWQNPFHHQGISTPPFQPSNCAFGIDWPISIKEKFSGTPLKNIRISCGEKAQKGEAVLTEFGLEGNAIYALSPEIREGLKSRDAKISIDFKPQLSAAEIQQKLSTSAYLKRSEQLKKELKLSPLQLSLLRTYVDKKAFLNDRTLAEKIKSFELNITKTATLNEAISSVGGISLNEITDSFELKKLPQHYCIGEMLDWDAPTGGYLLQACFSMGYYLAQRLE